MRVYNLYGRRDNKYKARIKILVHETGAEEFARQVEAEFAELKDGELKLPEADIRAHRRLFRAAGARRRARKATQAVKPARLDSRSFGEWLDQNVDHAPASRLCRGHDLAEAHRRGAGRRHATARWTRSPTSPSTTPSTRSASATSRT